MAAPGEYDLIVVGAGMAGIIAAARIAERGINPRTGDRLRVALIEAGPHVLKGKAKPGYGDPLNRKMIPQILWEEFGMLEEWPWAFGLKAVGGCSLHWGCHVHLPFP
jgi:choline dehydrogenase-like flavoprotein